MGLVYAMADQTTSNPTNLIEYTVSELAFALKRTVEQAYGLVRLRGEMEITPGTIEMELDVPLLLRPFRKRALAIVDEETRGWIEKAKAGEI